jgi:hypothetical protein
VPLQRSPGHKDLLAPPVLPVLKGRLRLWLDRPVRQVRLDRKVRLVLLALQRLLP